MTAVATAGLITALYVELSDCASAATLPALSSSAVPPPELHAALRAATGAQGHDDVVAAPRYVARRRPPRPAGAAERPAVAPR